jgi:hypothetical protein
MYSKPLQKHHLFASREHLLWEMIPTNKVNGVSFCSVSKLEDSVQLGVLGLSVLKNDTVVVKMNNSIGPYFLSHKGVRQQGDPLSPLLFNIVTDVLTRMVYLA